MTEIDFRDTKLGETYPLYLDSSILVVRHTEIKAATVPASVAQKCVVRSGLSEFDPRLIAQVEHTLEDTWGYLVTDHREIFLGEERRVIEVFHFANKVITLYFAVQPKDTNIGELLVKRRNQCKPRGR